VTAIRTLTVVLIAATASPTVAARLQNHLQSQTVSTVDDFVKDAVDASQADKYPGPKKRVEPEYTQEARRANHLCI